MATQIISTFLIYTIIGTSYLLRIQCHNFTITDIANDLVTVLINNEKQRDVLEIPAFQQKLVEISKFVADKDEFMKLLMEEVSNTTLVKTNFYEALKDQNEFDFLRENDTRNLYLKLKERINRDDVMKILAEGPPEIEGLGLVKSARKALGNIGEEVSVPEDDVLQSVVDKFLAQVPYDDHKFNGSVKSDMYWDPQPELEELKDFHGRSGRRLYKGEKTSVKNYPFMVSIEVLGRFWCGGVIYWHDLILTTASCLQLMHNNRFFRENPRVLQIRVGSNHSRIGGEKVDALEVYFHPGYNPRTLLHNIAVIRLRRHLFFSYHRIPKVIQLAEFQFPPSPTNQVLLLGWGVKKSSQKMSYEPVFLQSKILPVYPNVFCKEVYGSKFVTSTMFCAGTMTTGEGACDHDAGGPGIIGGKLAGLISFGPSVCGFPNAPTVFTLIGPYIDWIETVNESMPTYYQGKRKTTTTKSYLTRRTRHPGLHMFMTPLSSHEISETPVSLPFEIVTTFQQPSPTGTTTTKAAKKMKRIRQEPKRLEIPEELPQEYHKIVRQRPRLNVKDELDLTGTGFLSIDLK